MPFTHSGKHYSLRAVRFCKRCQGERWHQGISCRYRAPPEQKEVVEPSDEAKIFNRLLRLSDDYNILHMDIESLPNEIVLRVRLPDFDMSEIRAIQTKETETGFITVEELIRLQKAGYRRPGDIPPRPMPKDRRTLRERARERMFTGEPRSA